MKARELQQRLLAGPLTIEFGPRIEDLEGYPEPGMRARLVSLQFKHDDIVAVTVNFAPFEAHNRGLESANYFDRNGNAVLTAREAGFYKQLESLYAMADDDLSEYFMLIDDGAQGLFEAFQASGEPSYVRWLEQQLLAARQAA